MHTVKDAADRLGISANTLRVWTREFGDYLSPTASPPAGQERRFADDDMSVLWTIRHLRHEGQSADAIHGALRAGERMEPLEPTPDAHEAAGARDDRPPEAMALAIVQQQIGRLETERDYLRDRLEAEQSARLAAEIRATRAETMLEALQARPTMPSDAPQEPAGNLATPAPENLEGRQPGATAGQPGPDPGRDQDMPEPDRPESGSWRQRLARWVAGRNGA